MNKIDEITCKTDCYSASNFNQLCQDFDRLNKKYLTLKKACDEAEPECWYDGNKFYANEESASMSCADMGNLKPLFTRPAPVIASEQKPVDLRAMCIEDENSFMLVLANRIAGNSHPEENDRLDVAYAIARHLKLDWPSANETNSENTAAIEQRVAEAIASLGELNLSERQRGIIRKWREYL